MNPTTRHYFFPTSSDSSMCVSSPTSAVGDRTAAASGGGRNSRPTIPRSPPQSSSFVMRVAVRVSRARWFGFLRRVFHYQNASRPDPASNPFDSGAWMALELAALLLQISATTVTVAVSEKERPVWPMRMWVVGYDIGCLLSLLVLYGRYRHLTLARLDASLNLSQIEQQRGLEESRSRELMNKCRTSLELFFAIWFVMGNVWVFDSRFGSFRRAPKLHVLCISLLAWNAVAYSFPFFLFLLLCCCVPLISNLLAYDISAASADKGASDDQISRLPAFNYKALGDNNNDDSECCICLAKYRDKEEVRQLPCSHMFHLKCVDQWLRILSCCPLCKQQLVQR